MDSIKNKIEQLAKALGKSHIPDTYTEYKEVRVEYERLANQDVRKLQLENKLKRIQEIHGRSDLNPKWTFNTLVEDSEDVIEAVSIAQSFIAAHDDPNWRKSGSHMMIFYGDYGRGKSHIAGAIAHQLIEQYEISVLYRQLSSLLEMRFFSYDYNATDNVAEQFREIQRELLEVDLLILDEVCVNETMLKKNTQSWLGNLLRQRLVNHKNCIMITNHNLAELETALGRYCFESMKEYDTYKVKFSGPSRRKEITPQAAEPMNVSGYQPNQVK
ncbi:DnaA/Hda family protein [Aliiglaciecola sp. LCG003]|uniref:DnaA ATPase domain-containing protein n=1 Tax=Aliiglaciecola sp. LCG003 TaxID=3053655 RepID=UPI00257321F3|nr:DnaA/Hda family protein [Aliiglaciecola sp. LCG003]WJG09450.1 DnaA/Hda family protein [Aliiglaciecola sp. LCG003]